MSEFENKEQVDNENTQPEVSKSEKLKEQKDLVKAFVKKHSPVLAALTLTVLGSFAFGYMIGHRQGLTVVGFAADAEQLAEVVQKQKAELEKVTQRFNATVQERDVAVSNANKFYQSYHDANSKTTQMETLNKMYSDLLRSRGGVSLTVQNVSIKPLPENAFEYVIDLVQVNEGNRRATGSAEVRLIRGDEILSVPLENKKFDFDNYARLTGRWTMPDGFTPQYIEVRLSGSTPVAKRFSWQRGNETRPASMLLSEIPQVKENSN